MYIYEPSNLARGSISGSLFVNTGNYDIASNIK